jgi:predicted amidophosphoribosyltransferase
MFAPRGMRGKSDEEFAICPQCREQKYGFERARRCGHYEGALAGAILLQWYPVPLHQRKKEREFNQLELFARPLARRLGIPYRPVLLMRTRTRPEKHLLDYEERWESVRGAFALKQSGRVDNSRILLLDDVMTTGATLDACSRALADADASSVIALP